MSVVGTRWFGENEPEDIPGIRWSPLDYFPGEYIARPVDEEEEEEEEEESYQEPLDPLLLPPATLRHVPVPFREMVEDLMK